MAKIFNGIRKTLLKEGKTANYLKYAIGEIILVVVGILIALQINNWNEGQKAEANTVTYVNNLIEDLKKDHLVYTDQINAAQLRFKYCKDINEIINEGKTITDTSAFIVNLQAVGRLSIPTITDNTYKDLISTGNIKLIKNKKIIDAIGIYYSNPLAWFYTDYKNQLVNGYLPLAVDAIPMYIHEQIMNNETVNTFQEADVELLNNHIEHFTKKDVTDIMDALVRNKAFNFELKRITRSHLVLINILKLSDKSAKSLMNSLEAWKMSNK